MKEKGAMKGENRYIVPLLDDQQTFFVIKHAGRGTVHAWCIFCRRGALYVEATWLWSDLVGTSKVYPHLDKDIPLGTAAHHPLALSYFNS